MDLHVDLGQIIIAALIAVVGFLMKQEIQHFSDRLNKHETIILSLVGDVQRLIGINIGYSRVQDARGERQESRDIHRVDTQRTTP